MPKIDPRKATPAAKRKPSEPQTLDTASSVQSEVVAVTQQLASDVISRCLRHRPTDRRVREPASVQRLLAGLQRGGSESDQESV